MVREIIFDTNYRSGSDKLSIADFILHMYRCRLSTIPYYINRIIFSADTSFCVLHPRNISADKPGPASITYEPRQVMKKQALSITCFVLDPGRPRVSGFKWLRGWYRLPDENEATLFIESVNLETEANFTCLAFNDAGDGEPATTFIDVSGE